MKGAKTTNGDPSTSQAQGDVDVHLIWSLKLNFVAAVAIAAVSLWLIYPSDTETLSTSWEASYTIAVLSFTVAVGLAFVGPVAALQDKRRDRKKLRGAFRWICLISLPIIWTAGSLLVAGCIYSLDVSAAWTLPHMGAAVGLALLVAGNLRQIAAADHNTQLSELRLMEERIRRNILEEALPPSIRRVLTSER